MGSPHIKGAAVAVGYTRVSTKREEMISRELQAPTFAGVNQATLFFLVNLAVR